MAELIKKEQEVKRPSFFLKIENGCKVVLQSNLIRVQTHYLEDHKQSVLCISNDCYFCDQGIDSRNEYLYLGTLDGEKGFIRLPASIFYSMNENERLLKKSKREMEWIISKKGTGLATRYSAVRGDDVKPDPKEIEKNNQRLLDSMNRYEAGLKQRYDEIVMNEGSAEEPR